MIIRNKIKETKDKKRNMVELFLTVAINEDCEKRKKRSVECGLRQNRNESEEQ